MPLRFRIGMRNDPAGDPGARPPGDESRVLPHIALPAPPERHARNQREERRDAGTPDEERRPRGSAGEKEEGDLQQREPAEAGAKDGKGGERPGGEGETLDLDLVAEPLELRAEEPACLGGAGCPRFPVKRQDRVEGRSELRQPRPFLPRPVACGGS